jgi:anti-sigma factor RsiW
MNPDKLFDYLDGKLSAGERADFEARVMSDEQLQRELAVARRIHSSMQGDSREVTVPDLATEERGRKMALRFGIFFIALMGINVVAGLWIIAHKESKNPNRQLLENQTRDQIKKSLEAAAAAALAPTPSLGVSQLTISAGPGRLDSVADEVVSLANRLGGSGTKGISDQHRVGRTGVDTPAEDAHVR